MITWYAAYTQPNAEAKAVDQLQRQGYGVYLPAYRRWIRHARKRVFVSRPLFPRYLFVGVDRLTQLWRPIRSTVGVVGLVTGGDDPIPVAPAIIETLRRREGEGAFDLLSPVQKLRSGDAVRVTEGPFEHVVGRLVGLADHERVHILLDLLGRTVRAEVAARVVEAA